MGIGGSGGLGGFLDGLKSGVTKVLTSLSFIPSGTPIIGGVASVAKIAVNKLNIPSPIWDDDSDDEFGLDDVTASNPLARIMERKIFGVPIVPLMLGGVVLSFVLKGKK